MKSEKRTSLYIIIAIAFIILFLIFASKPLAKEYHFQPEWKVNVSAPTVKTAATEKAMYYRLGQNFGYITENGELIFSKSFPSRISISDDYYAIYNTNSTNIPFYHSDGQQAGTFETLGYPFFYKDLIFSFLPGGGAFAKCDENGKISWQHESTLPITAFSCKNNYSIAGYANGTIKVFDNNDGSIDAIFAPGGSDIPVILGCDVSEDGKYIATISGYNKQRFVLSYKDNNQIKIIYHRFLEKESPNQVLVHFCQDQKRVVYNYEGAIGIYNFEKEVNNIINIDKSIISIKETDNLIVLLGKNKKDYSVYMIDKNNTLEGSFSFKSENAFINTDNSSIYVGKDNCISKIKVDLK